MDHTARQGGKSIQHIRIHIQASHSDTWHIKVNMKTAHQLKDLGESKDIFKLINILLENSGISKLKIRHSYLLPPYFQPLKAPKQSMKASYLRHLPLL